MADRYASFSELAKSERRDRDYRIRWCTRRSDLVVIAPHGGGIEPGTSELAEAIAGHEYSFYAFEGIKARANRDLHLTSVRFDEPECLALVTASARALAIHGESGDPAMIYLGGRDEEMLDRLRTALAQRDFSTERHLRPGMQGLDPTNICNRTLSQAGVQLELSRGLRRAFLQSHSTSVRRGVAGRFADFVAAVREGLR